MSHHFDLSDNEFETAFKDCTLLPEIFNHEAHLRLAWIHIANYGYIQAEKNIENQLHKFVVCVGAKDKYHKTLTIVGVRIVDHYMKRKNISSFKAFIAEYPELKTSFKSLIDSHYSIDVFSSEKAKSEFLEPDLLPFE